MALILGGISEHIATVRREMGLFRLFFSRFVAALDISKYLKLIEKPRSLHTCVPKLPFDIISIIEAKKN